MNTYNLTTPQQNIWNLQKTFSDTSISNLCGTVFFEKKIDNRIIEKAINRFIELQSGMRLQFREENAGTVQYITEYEYVDFPFISFNNRASFERYAQDFAKQPFQMTDSPMYRFLIFELNGISGVLACLNHLISDAWTFSLLAKGIYNLCFEFESDCVSGHENYNYVDFIETEKKYLKSERCQKDETYWTEVYSKKPEPCPIKLINTPVTVPTAQRFTTVLTAEQTEKINSYCSENNVSQAVLFETAVFAYLSRANSENKQITIGIPVLNRKTKSDKSTVGMYISTTPLTVEVSAEDTAAVLINRITETHSQVFRHQRYPYSNILTQIRQKHQYSENLYDVMVSFQNAKTNEDITTQWFTNGYSEVPFVLHIDNRDSADGYTLNVDYQTEVFPNEEEVRLLVERLMLIIDQIIENPETTVSEINIIPAEEYQKVIFDFNNTAVEYPKDKCIHELFSEQAAKTPNKIALVFEDKKFTYKQLDEMSNSLAHYLREEKSIKPNNIVPIISKRSWHIIVAMLGVLKAGGAYMLIDSNYPTDRIKYLIGLCNNEIVLTCGCEYTNSVRLEYFNYTYHVSPVVNCNKSGDLFCAIHTSGSTGIPKLTTLTHSNISHYIKYSKYFFKDTKQTISTTIITFDAFIQETIVALCNDKTVILCTDDEMTNQNSFEAMISQYNDSFLFQTPTKLLSYIRNSKDKGFIKHISCFVIGGEIFPDELFNLISEYNSDCRIYNIYGPTETTICATTDDVIDEIDITIGKPIANTQIYILDKNRKPLPIGVAGELCISGDGVGKGYLNRPELTAEKFIPNPFIEGKTMYCTGDFARWRADGELEYLGRIDTQVKIRGLRIELGEIESVMSGFNGIRLTAVTDKRDENNRQYLVGYYTAEKEIDEKKLRHHLSAKLPKYMIPNYFVHLADIPMTASGKTDRKNLPLPDFTQSKSEYIAPETETENKLCDLLALLFGIEKVSVTDDFFELGGDSLRAIEYIAKAHNIGVEINLQDVFDYPTVRELCDFLANGTEKVIAYSKKDFDKYKEILSRNVIDENFVPKYEKGFRDKHIAIIGENSYEWLVAFLAIVNGGNVAVPIDKEQPAERIKQLLMQSDCEAVIVSKSYADLAEHLENIVVFSISDFSEYVSAGQAAINGGKNEYIDYKIYVDKLAAIFFTSGTTGSSKGVMLSHKNMASDINFACKNFRLDGDTLAVLPFHHTFGLITAIFKVFNYRHSTYINKGLKHIQKDLQIVKPQTVFWVPLFIETFYKNIMETARKSGKDKTLIRAAKISGFLLSFGIDLRRKLFKSVHKAFGGNLEYIICGGAPLDAKYVKAFRSWGINILNGYGITECSPVVSVNRNFYWRDGSIGQILDGCQVKIADDGEILVKGDNVMMGYYKDDISTSEVMVDGWYHTRDLGHIDKGSL